MPICGSATGRARIEPWGLWLAGSVMRLAVQDACWERLPLGDRGRDLFGLPEGILLTVLIGALSGAPLTPAAACPSFALHPAPLCGDLSAGASVPLERPADLPATFDTPHFRIHYTTHPSQAPLGWPNREYVETTGAFCEQIWRTMHGELGWPEPLADGLRGGDARTDVYLADLAGRLLGYSRHESMEAGAAASGFIVIDNDYRSSASAAPRDLARRVLAHEYQHLIQYRFGTDPAVAWFREQCATMMERRLAAEDASAPADVSALVRHPYQRLDLCNGSFEYAAWLWPQFLTERYGDRFVLAIWREWSTAGGSLIAALDHILAPSGGLDRAFAAWAVWNAFLGARDDGRHYTEGAVYGPAIEAEMCLHTFPVERARPAALHRPAPLGAGYVELSPEPTSADNRLAIDVTIDGAVASVSLIIWWRDDRPAEVRELVAGAHVARTEILGWDEVERTWIVVTGKHDAEHGGDFAVSATTEFDPATIGEGQDLIASGLQLAGHPNPFDRYAIIRYQLAQQGPVTLRVLDAAGRVVETLYDGVRSAGAHAVRWSDIDASQPTRSGVYFCEIRTRQRTERIRLVRVR